MPWSPSPADRSRWNDTPTGPKAPVGVGLSSRSPVAANRVLRTTYRQRPDRQPRSAPKRVHTDRRVGCRCDHLLAASRRRSKNRTELVRSRRQLHPSTNTSNEPMVASRDTFHGVRGLSAKSARRSLRRFTSPTPSAPGVSRSLSGLIPTHLVTMFHVTFAHRLFDLQSFSRAISRPASRRSLLSCLWGFDRRLSVPISALASELFSDRASDTRCRVFTPVDEPLLSWPFPSSRSTGTLRRAEALPSHAFHRANHVGSAAGISGFQTHRPGHGSGESHQPP
jgi:hypothetical protein